MLRRVMRAFAGKIGLTPVAINPATLSRDENEGGEGKYRVSSMMDHRLMPDSDLLLSSFFFFPFVRIISFVPLNERFANARGGRGGKILAKLANSNDGGRDKGYPEPANEEKWQNTDAGTSHLLRIMLIVGRKSRVTIRSIPASRIADLSDISVQRR